MKYVFGPLPTRRLGRSLGIDTIPLKTCNWNCVYCQLGRSKPLCSEFKAYFPPEEILAEVKEALDKHKAGGIDWITFVGAGEPTLHSGIGDLIRAVKAMSDLPVAVITNGSTLYLEEVRQALLPVDAVLPSVDAGTKALYRKLNRPHPEFTFERLVEGLTAFRSEYAGQIWVEVMLVRGMNDTESALRDTAAVLQRSRPDEVHINLPTRPPAETWVQPPDEEGLMRAKAILGGASRIVQMGETDFVPDEYQDLGEAILAVVTRHPMKQEELAWVLGVGDAAVERALAELAASGQAQRIERYGVAFWSAGEAYYAKR